MPKAAQRQFLVSIEGLPGYWMTKGGGNVSADTSKVYDGGRLRPELIAAPAEPDNVTVSKAYDPGTDSVLLTQLRKEVGRRTATITVQQTDRDLVPVGLPTVYPSALLVTLTEPEFDASSGDASTWTLEWAIGEFA